MMITYEVRYDAVTKIFEDGKYEFLITSADELTTNLAVSVLNSETAELHRQIAELQSDLVNAKVEVKMLQEQVDLVAAAEDIVENLLDPDDTRLAELEAENARMKAVMQGVAAEMKISTPLKESKIYTPAMEMWIRRLEGDETASLQTEQVMLTSEELEWLAKRT